jgi:hypothetical protein
VNICLCLCARASQAIKNFAEALAAVRRIQAFLTSPEVVTSSSQQKQLTVASPVALDSDKGVDGIPLVVLTKARLGREFLCFLSCSSVLR